MDLNQEIELLFVEDSAHDAELTIRALKKIISLIIWFTCRMEPRRSILFLEQGSMLDGILIKCPS
jgi:hypothetical protein